MNYKQHLIFGGIINGIFLFVLYRLDIIIFESIAFLPLLTTFYIFTLLPDIDNPKSHISKVVLLLLLYLLASSIYGLYKAPDMYEFFKIFILSCVFVLFVVYVTIFAEDTYLHRGFPHTFTFGAIACTMLYLIVNSLLITLVGAISFFTHILCDGHVRESIKRDIHILKLKIPT